MLIKFSVGNYLSFKEIQTIDLTPESLKEKENENFLHIPYLFDPKTRILKSAGIYGHNSHGKSNFLKAYQFFLDFIFSSFSLGKNEESIPVEKFRLNKEMQDKPSHFEIQFYHRDVKYRYGFKITALKVVEEWLHYSEYKIRENYLFERAEQEYRVSKIWNKEADSKVDKSIFFTTPRNLLFSALISQGEIPRITEISKWLRGNIIITDITEEKHLKEAIIILSHPKFRGTINKFVEKADLGFVTIVEKIDGFLKNKISYDKQFLELVFASELDRYELYTKHDFYNKDKKLVDSIMFEMSKSESSGTIKYFILVCYLSLVIKQGQLIWIDEIDSKFHSLLLKFLLKTFHDRKINSLGAQMIFTTHNTAIMNQKVMRRDQLLVVEKDKYGESVVKRMHGARKPIRIDTQVEKEYLEGKLGGVSNKLREENDQRELDF